MNETFTVQYLLQMMSRIQQV